MTTYDTDFTVTEGFGSIRENYKRLIHFVYHSATRYKEGRNKRSQTKYKNVMYIPMRLSSELKVQPAREINGSLFVNSLLWYVFSEVGMDSSMFNKRGHQYPSNGINQLYQRSWSVKEFGPKKLMLFKQIHNKCAELLDIQDCDWVRTVEQVIIPLFISACENSKTPIYNPADKTYHLENKQVIIDWLVRLVQSVLTPGHDGPITSVILRGADEAIKNWSEKAKGSESKSEVAESETEKTVDAPDTSVQEPAVIPEVQAAVNSDIAVDFIKMLIETLECPVEDMTKLNTTVSMFNVIYKLMHAVEAKTQAACEYNKSKT